MELFKIFGSLIIQDDDAIKLLNNAEQKAKMTAKQVQNLGDSALKMGKTIAVGAGIAVTALFGIANKSAQVAGDLDDSAQRVGMSAEEYQKWAYAAKLSGVEQEKLEQIMKKQQTVFADASQGVGTASAAYQALGIDITGLTASGAFEQAISALANMDDETQRNAIANDLFGKSYADLAPMLNAGSDGINKLRQDAVDLGLVMSNESVASGAAFGDMLDTVTKSFETVVAEVGVQVMPIFEKFLQWVIDNMPEIKKTIEDVMNGIADAIKWVSDNIDWILPVLGGLLGAFVAFQVVSMVAGLFTMFAGAAAGASGAMAVLNLVMLANPIGMVALAIGALIAIGVALWMNWDVIKEKAGALWTSIKDVFGKIKDFVKNVWDSITSIIKLPTITIQGDLNPLTWLKNGIPKFNVNWNADGGIFDQPTIFNTRAGLQGVGESGPEAIMPLSKLDSMLSNNGIDYDLLADKIVQAMSKVSIVLDKDTVGTFVDKRILKGAY